MNEVAGDSLRKFRKDLNLSIEKAAKFCKVTPLQFAGLEKGRYNIKSIEKAGELLNVYKNHTALTPY